MRIALMAIWGLLVCASPAALSAQEACPAPPIPPPSRDNIFTEEQESHLGDIMAEHLGRSYRVIADDEVRAHLLRIGERLVKHLPPSGIRFQFFLVDLPVVNAYAFPGGRIYVTRKLVAATRNEDELAGVLGHEIGHAVARDGAVTFSRVIRELLRVSEVGDRNDVTEKFHQYLENFQRRPEAVSRAVRGQSHQIQADQLGLYLVARAGYSPTASVEMWDRTAETKGRKGNWFTDLLGTTRPESRRLREMSRTLAALPRECMAARRAAMSEEYLEWQKQVVAYSGLGHKESVPGLIARRQLDPPLRGEITHLRFSPDGQYILAQDDSGISVLSREPFTPLFRIDAAEAFPAQFTPDSENIVFHNSDLRVEWWNIAEEQRTAAYEIGVSKGCYQTMLSPDGKLLACYGTEFDLRLLDVESGQTVYSKKDFYIPDALDYFLWRVIWILNESYQAIKMAFSPDGAYFLAGRGRTALALSLRNNYSTVSLPGSIRRLVHGGFAFLGPDRLIGVDADRPERSAIVTFPAGQVLSELALGRQDLAAPGRGNYVLLRPIDKYAVGVMNLETKKIFMANKTAALDIYENVYVAERVTGELALYSSTADAPLARATLPRGTLGRLRAVAVSPALDWLAVSQRSRGAVWDLTRGERVFHVRGFRGAHIEGDTLYADFPKFEETERQIARLHLAKKSTGEGPQVTERDATQYGPFVMQFQPAKKDGDRDKNVTLEVRSARDLSVLWARQFPREAPDMFVEPLDGTMVLRWGLRTSHAREAIRNDPALRTRSAQLKEKDGDYYLEVVSARTGQTLGQLLIETGKGSFRITTAQTRGDWLVMTDNQNRVLVYSLSTGEQQGRVFGSKAAVAPATGLVIVENVQGQLALYDLATMERRQEFSFPHAVSWARFSDDGKRLFVLTDNQAVYWIDVSGAAAGSVARQ